MTNTKENTAHREHSCCDKEESSSYIKAFTFSAKAFRWTISCTAAALSIYWGYLQFREDTSPKLQTTLTSSNLENKLKVEKKKSILKEITQVQSKQELKTGILSIPGLFYNGIPHKYLKEYTSINLQGVHERKPETVWIKQTSKDRIHPSYEFIINGEGKTTSLTITSELLGKDQYNKPWTPEDFVDQIYRLSAIFKIAVRDNYDADGDNYFSPNEMRPLFEHLDTDENEKISWEEINNFKPVKYQWEKKTKLKKEKPLERR